MRRPGAGTWCAVVLAGLMAPAAQAQTRITFDWANGSNPDATEVEAGRSVTFQIANVDRACYSYRLTFTQPETPDRINEVGTLLGIATRMSPEKSADPAADAPLKGLNLTGLPADDREELTKLSTGVKELTEALSGTITRIGQAYNNAAEAVSKALACPTPRPRSAAAAELRQGWYATEVPLSELDDALDLGSSDSAAHAASLAGLRQRLERLRTEFTPEQMAPLDNQIKVTLPGRQARLASRLAEARAGAAELRKTGEALRKPIERVVRIKNTADSVGVTVSATPRDASAAVEDPTVWLDVEGGGPRVYFTSGYFGSTLDDPHYEEVLRPAPVQGDPDSTVSTYRSRNDGSPTHAPFIAANLRVASIGRSFDAAISFGTALRTVNGESHVDVLFGLSGLIHRIIAVSAGLHWGKREYLLIAQNVLDAGLSPKLTRESIVGTRMQPDLYFGVSIRLTGSD